MKRERLTHSQRRERTREFLFEAARKMFIEKGVAATSVEEIAEAAGYTRGAFYSNFGGKRELLIELLRREDDRALVNLQGIMKEGGTAEEMKERVVAHYSRSFLENDCFPLWVEAKLLAGRDTAFQERFSAFRHNRFEQIGAYVGTISDRNGGPMVLPTDALALGLMSLCDGVQFFRMCDPQLMTDKVMHTVLAAFFSCALWRSSKEMALVDHRAVEPD
ncbi:TetR family transcriptional regulator [Paraburkholderia sp. BL6665CI2N2]|uniref:TetR/AcrR family transcriptional regulator n=1 Tax=Paraburkholderia sp. BL6665CI2N2 TaxID=1938806 RepID=UPI00106621F2|nr:TetR/AcrR family transcriptional regulator [Paraburkholderia sp. BL6665CI2N2]TDY23062.1 TetR family transcriptional regulator [Paraburkholderia sp. BL6665CI2N2]